MTSDESKVETIMITLHIMITFPHFLTNIFVKEIE